MGGIIIISNLINVLLDTKSPIMKDTGPCIVCDDEKNCIFREIPVIEIIPRMLGLLYRKFSQIEDSMETLVKEALNQGYTHRCEDCLNRLCYSGLRFIHAPPILAVNIKSITDIPIKLELNLSGVNNDIYTMSLAVLIYHGYNYFPSRIGTEGGATYYNATLMNSRSCGYEKHFITFRPTELFVKNNQTLFFFF